MRYKASAFQPPPPLTISFFCRYEQSLSVLRAAKASLGGVLATKSSIMLGLGEKKEEVEETMRDLREAGVDILTLGQYLQPTPLHLPVKEYVEPHVFDRWREYGESLGFRYVASGPLVRGWTPNWRIMIHTSL